MPPCSEHPQSGNDECPVAEQLKSVTSELRVIRDVLGEIYEQIHWLVTNGLPRWEPSIYDRETPEPSPVFVQPKRKERADRQTPETTLVYDVVDQLETRIASIATDQLALFIDALDDVRDELVAALKGDPQQALPFDESYDDGHVPPQPVLETERTDAQPSDPSSPRTAHTETPVAPHARPERTLFDSRAFPRTLFEPGQAVLVSGFGVAETDAEAEIVAIDDAYNNATVELLLSREQLTVSQDLLTRIEPDPLGPANEDGSPTGVAADA